jgi:hypothetical protein
VNTKEIFEEKNFSFENIVLTILNPAPMSEKLNLDLLKLSDVICPNQTEVIIFNEKSSVEFFFLIGRNFM